jgi:hypothetical protein
VKGLSGSLSKYVSSGNVTKAISSQKHFAQSKAKDITSNAQIGKLFNEAEKLFKHPDITKLQAQALNKEPELKKLAAFDTEHNRNQLDLKPVLSKNPIDDLNLKIDDVVGGIPYEENFN